MSRVAGIAAAVLVMAACGKRGPPLPPLRPIPARVADFTADVRHGTVTLRFTVPDRNLDETQPVAIDGIEIYRATAHAGAPGVPAGQIVRPEQLVTTIGVRTAADPPGGAARPAPGEGAVYVARLPEAGAEGSWRYVVLGVAGGRRGPPSAVAEIPLTIALEPPASVQVSYDERSWTISWPTSAGESYQALDVTAGAEGLEVLSAGPVQVGTHVMPVTFGLRRCFAVRTIKVEGIVTLVSEPGEPACETAEDRFPPAAPSRLVATTSAEAVALEWLPSASSDVTGYLVLRGTDADETLRALATEPVTGTSYRDQTAVAGVTYSYAVVAVDRAGNRSEMSNRQTIRRAPVGAGRRDVTR